MSLSYGSALKFSGFSVGDDKNKTINTGDKYYDWSNYPNTYSYINKFESGWRVFNIGDTLEIITAGTPEIYSLVYGSSNGEISNYILSSGQYQSSYSSSYNSSVG